MVPTIHLNGTSRESLIEATCNAADKLRDALDTLRQMGPNGRDYYPQGPDALHKAVDEHLARMGKVQAVLDELEAFVNAIPERGGGVRPS